MIMRSAECNAADGPTPAAPEEDGPRLAAPLGERGVQSGYNHRMDAPRRIEELKRELAANPASRQFYQLGELLRRAGRGAEAAEALRAGLANHPRYVAAWVALGRASLDLGKADEAVTALREGLVLDAQNPVAWRLLSEAHMALGDRLSALDAMQRCLELVPGDEVLTAAVEALAAETHPPKPRPAAEPEAAAPPVELAGPASGEAPAPPPAAAVAPSPAAVEPFAAAAPEPPPAVVAAVAEPFAVPLPQPFAVPEPQAVRGDVFDLALEPLGQAASADGLVFDLPEFAAAPPAAPALAAPPLSVVGESIPPAPAEALLAQAPPALVAEPTPAVAQAAVLPPLEQLAEASPVVEAEPEPVAEVVTVAAEPAAPAPPAPAGTEPFGAGEAVPPAAEAQAPAPTPAAARVAPPLPLPTQPRATVSLARLYVQQQDLARAADVLERVLERDGSNMEARELLALVHDMMVPLPEPLPPLSARERKIAALQRWLAYLTLGRERAAS